MKTAQLTTLYLTGLLGILPIAAFAQLNISVDGLTVADSKTTLTWKRCAEGMTWDGTSCTGSATTFTHDQALQQATNQAGAGWRLPNVKELSSIVDKNSINPAIDSTSFPATPASLFWSSSPFVTLPSSAWVVDFGVGVVGGTSNNRNGTLHPYFVRLVQGGL
jgi:hypothetical protein